MTLTHRIGIASRTDMLRWMPVVRLCARQERLLAARSRWTQLFAAAFAALALAVAIAGYVLSGGSGVQDFARTTVSLVQLVLLLVPMTALTVGVLSLAPDRGHAELLYAQPAPRGAILIGQLLGLLQALVAAQALGFGLAGLVIFSQSGQEGVGAFFLLIGASVLLTVVFLGLAAALAAGRFGPARARALAMALVLWFVLVLLYDLAALGLASLLPSAAASRVLIVAVLLNPVDAIRTGALLGIEGASAFGAASLAFLRFTHGPVSAALLVTASAACWIVAPILFAWRRLARTDI